MWARNPQYVEVVEIGSNYYDRLLQTYAHLLAVCSLNSSLGRACRSLLSHVRNVHKWMNTHILYAIRCFIGSQCSCWSICAIWRISSVATCGHVATRFCIIWIFWQPSVPGSMPLQWCSLDITRARAASSHALSLTYRHTDAILHRIWWPPKHVQLCLYTYPALLPNYTL